MSLGVNKVTAAQLAANTSLANLDVIVLFLIMHIFLFTYLFIFIFHFIQKPEDHIEDKWCGKRMFAFKGAVETPIAYCLY